MSPIAAMMAQAVANALRGRADPRLEDNPAYVRDPGNSQENDMLNAPSVAPGIDPQLLPFSPRFETDPMTMFLRRQFSVPRGA